MKVIMSARTNFKIVQNLVTKYSTISTMAVEHNMSHVFMTRKEECLVIEMQT